MKRFVLIFITSIAFSFQCLANVSDQNKEDSSQQKTESTDQEKTDNEQSADDSNSADNSNKENKTNILDTIFYEEGADTSYDEEPITFLGINARWLSDKLPNHALSHLFSFDLGYTLTSWQNNGWGIGCNYEQKIWRYFSIRGTLATQTIKIGKSDTWSTGYETDLNFFCYPFGKGLEWLYLGCGGGSDFLFYSGDKVPETNFDIIFSVTPSIGWKQIFFKNFMIDTNVGYRFIIDNTNNYEDSDELVRSGIQVGIRVHIFWRKLLKSFIDNRILKKSS
ncbi:MAG: hypothetical protein IJL70_01950 [Treponema sp.]|nr:hypothetical protein [Treponema sp.]